MSDILEISRKHGQEMYILGLKHAVSIIEILGESGVDKLKEQINAAKKELGDGTQ
jgi:hypothetical protein